MVIKQSEFQNLAKFEIFFVQRLSIILIFMTGWPQTVNFWDYFGLSVNKIGLLVPTNCITNCFSHSFLTKIMIISKKNDNLLKIYGTYGIIELPGFWDCRLS